MLVAKQRRHSYNVVNQILCRESWPMKVILQVMQWWVLSSKEDWGRGRTPGGYLEIWSNRGMVRCKKPNGNLKCAHPLKSQGELGCMYLGVCFFSKRNCFVGDFSILDSWNFSRFNILDVLFTNLLYIYFSAELFQEGCFNFIWCFPPGTSHGLWFIAYCCVYV